MPTFPPDPVPGSPVSASWMRRFLAACRASMPIQGSGVRISYTPNGAIIGIAGAADVVKEPTKPFTVRWHQPDPNATGQWEIYMPLGCASVYAAATPLNQEASDTSGHANESDWYVLPLVDSPKTGDIYDVVVHLKQRAIDAADLSQYDDEEDPEVAPVALAWMHKRAALSDQTATEKTAYAGDVVSTAVASITWQEPSDGGSAIPNVIQSGVNSLNAPGSANQEFDLWWAFSMNGANLTVTKMGLLRRTLSTGTEVVTISEAVDVSGANEGIFLRVALMDGAIELTVALDVDDTTAGADFFIVQLYRVDQWHRTSDYRSALWRLPMYLGGGS